jgi:hypothetical protein
LSDFVLDNKGRHKWPVVYYSLLELFRILHVKAADGGADGAESAEIKTAVTMIDNQAAGARSRVARL